jgi:hypothetical protein
MQRTASQLPKLKVESDDAATDLRMRAVYIQNRLRQNVFGNYFFAIPVGRRSSKGAGNYLPREQSLESKPNINEPYRNDKNL